MNREDFKIVSKVLAPIKRMAMGIATRSKVRSSRTTSRGQILDVSLLQSQDKDGAEMYEPYGLAGAVPDGSEGVAIAIGGSRDNVIVVCASPKGGTPDGRKPGEVDVYSTHGQRIRLHEDGSISLTPSGQGKVYLGSEPNPALPFVNGHGDDCTMTPEFIAWAGLVSSALANTAIAALGATVGTYAPPGVAPTRVSTTVASASSTKVS